MPDRLREIAREMRAPITEAQGLLLDEPAGESGFRRVSPGRDLRLEGLNVMFKLTAMMKSPPKRQRPGA